MDRKAKVEEQNAKNAKLLKLRAITYKQVFGSVHGARVLADLEIQTGMNTSSARQAEFDANKTMFYEGQRSVFLHIRDILNTEVDDNE